MKIAITSENEGIDSALDKRFGRCSHFIIYDTVTQETVSLRNKASEADEGAGPAAVELIASKGVKKVVSGEFGIKIKPLLDSLGIQMIVQNTPGIRVSDVIALLKKK